MAKQYIKITPFDGAFFGKGRPFEMGDDSWTEAELLPPPPSVWGSLFSYLWYQDENLSLDSLKIGRIMIIGANSTQLFLPAPLDVFCTGELNKKLYHHDLFAQQEHDYVQWAGNNVLLKPYTEVPVDSPERELIIVSNLKDYVKTKEQFRFSLEKIDSLIRSDYKIGIARNEDIKTAEEGMLYTVNLAQLGEGYAWLVETETSASVSFPEKWVLKFGGEGKLALFEIYSDKEAIDKALAIGDTLAEEKVQWFKVYFSSPVKLNSNGLPEVLNHSDFSVVAGVVGRAVRYGGFDLKHGRPKPMELYAPAGSVYVLESKEAYSTLEAKEKLSYTNQLDKGFNQFEIFSY